MPMCRNLVLASLMTAPAALSGCADGAEVAQGDFSPVYTGI
jgi:hypothetical protein